MQAVQPTNFARGAPNRLDSGGAAGSYGPGSMASSRFQRAAVRHNIKYFESSEEEDDEEEPEEGNGDEGAKNGKVKGKDKKEENEEDEGEGSDAGSNESNSESNSEDSVVSEEESSSEEEVKQPNRRGLGRPRGSRGGSKKPVTSRKQHA